MGVAQAHPLRPARGLAAADAAERAALLAESGEGVLEMARNAQGARLDRLATEEEGAAEGAGDGGEAVVARLHHNTDEINSLAINAKGLFLAAADDEGSVAVLDLKQVRFNPILIRF